MFFCIMFMVCLFQKKKTGKIDFLLIFKTWHFSLLSLFTFAPDITNQTGYFFPLRALMKLQNPSQHSALGFHYY
jgi:hypothetical protein